MRALVLLAIAFSGCAPFVHSPPGRVLSLESARTLDKGQTGIRAGGGGGSSADSGFSGGFIRVRHGVARSLDLHVELSALSVSSNADVLGTDAVATAGAGIKYAFNPYLAVAVDLTGGYWKGGGFVSPELNFIAAYENARFVPFVDVGYYTSHPISANQVRIEGEPLFEPGFAQGWIAGAGIRLPTSNLFCCRFDSAIILGARVTGAYFKDPFDPATSPFGRGAIDGNSQIYYAGSAAIEVVFQ